MPYCTEEQIRSWLSIDDTHESGLLAVVRASAEDAVSAYCQQRFDVAAAATNVFRPRNGHLLDLGPLPLTAITTLKVDGDDDGTYETTWTAADYQLEPLNGIGDDGAPGWPYNRVRAIGGVTFPCSSYGRATVQIVGTFGWAAVPDNVRLATIITAAWLWTNKASPSGVQVTEFGPVQVRQIRHVDRLLAQFRRYEVAVG